MNSDKATLGVRLINGHETTNGFMIHLNGGAKRDRTADLLRARQALSQLSYGPNTNVTQIPVRQGKMRRRIACYTRSILTQYYGNLVGLGRLELPTSPLSGVRSNQLSYRPGLLSPQRRH